MFTTLSRATADGTPLNTGVQHHFPIRLWLLLCALLVLVTMSIGGMTRLTSSGLSITEWDPIMGIIPPLSSLDWLEAFDKYKTTYEYRFVNMNMTIDEFRYIFNWEWRHRLVARLIFLAVFIPFIYFLLAGRLSKGMQQRVLVVLGLIVLQGFIGWLMVQSGLRNDVKVSPYRLALHLGMASLLFAMLVAMAFGQDDRPFPQDKYDLSKSRVWGRVAVGLLFVLILFGALVAGLRGGRAHDTWPLMEGQLFPSNMFVLAPWFSNFFENPLTAQWFHRLLAYALLITTALHWRNTLRRDEPEAVRNSSLWLLVGVGAQLFIGIVTVLNQVPLPLGLLHQFWAFGLLALAIWHLYEIERYSVSGIASESSTTTWSETVTTSPAPVLQTATAAASASAMPQGTPVAPTVVRGGTVLVTPRPSVFPTIGTPPGVAAAGSASRPVAGVPVPLRRPVIDT